MIQMNPLLAAYLSLFIISSASDLIIDYINARYLKRHGRQAPQGFEGIIDGEKLRKIELYTLDKTRLSAVESITEKAVFLFIILSGILPRLTEVLQGVHFVPAGLLFFLLPAAAGAMVGLPFSCYHIFVLEERYGFNTRTVKTWIGDLIKSLFISIILGGMLLSLILLVIRYGGTLWWLWAWIVFFAFQLLMTLLYPTVIAPLFNKFTPIQDKDLADQIKRLAEGQGLTLKGIFQMDAGRRSRHTNAYFAGLGKAKRLVLYDTLLEAHDKEEILAVLAHEIGHFKLNHIRKQVLMTGVVSLLLFYIASLMIDYRPLYRAFGFSMEPVYAGLFLIAVVWGPVGFFLSPAAMAISRRFEREADRHAAGLTGGLPLARALKKMAGDNLSNLRPHPIYVRFNYSHPPILERVKALESGS